MMFLNAATILFINISFMLTVKSADPDLDRHNSHQEILDYPALFRKFIGSKPFLIPDDHFQFKNQPDGRRMKGVSFTGFFDSSPIPVEDSGNQFVKQDNTRGLGALPQFEYNPSAEWNSFDGFPEGRSCVHRMQGTSCRSNEDCSGCDTPFVCSWMGVCNEAFPYRKRTVKQTRQSKKNIWSRINPRSV